MRFTAWRISKAGHDATAPNGTGAHRWSSADAPVIYAAQSQALAVLEMLAHLDGQDLFDSYALTHVELDSQLVERLDASALSGDWRADPAPTELKRIGDAWLIAAKYPVLQVPSALLPQEHNFLLNTAHRDFHQLKFGEPVPFRFDPSLVKKG